MIDSVSQLSSQPIFNTNGINQLKLPNIADSKEMGSVAKAEPSAPFGNVLGKLVKDVAEKQQVAQVETNKMLLGETDNIHQSMIAVQEAGLAFTTLVEVRNKLVTSYQELMKMPV